MFGWMTKRAAFLAVVLASVLSMSARAQSADGNSDQAGSAALQEICQALRAGSVDPLMDRAADRVDLTIFGSSELLSRSQAKYVLMDFFRSYPPTRVEVHETSPSDGNWFASASYWYEGGDGPLTVYLRMRAKSADDWELRELRFGRSALR